MTREGQTTQGRRARTTVGVVPPRRNQGLWNQACFVALEYIPHPLTCTLD